MRTGTNADLDLTRNRIRHELIPHLKDRYNPAISEILARLASQAQDLFANEEREAQRLLAIVELPRAGVLVILNAQQLTALPAGSIRSVFRLIWQRENWPLGDMYYEHWDRMIQAAWGVTGAIDLPGGYHLCRRGAVVQVGPTAKKTNKTLSSGQ